MSKDDNSLQNIENALRAIEEVLEQGKRVAFSDNQVKIYVSDITDIIQEIRESYPEQLMIAYKISTDRAEIINDAEKEAADIKAAADAEAEKIVNAAKLEAARLVSAHEITAGARTEADRILDEAHQRSSALETKASKDAQAKTDAAKRYCETIKTDAHKYVDELLCQTNSIVENSYKLAAAAAKEFEVKKAEINNTVVAFRQRVEKQN